jgi:hypothetical protein
MAKAMAVIDNIPTTVFLIFSLLEINGTRPPPSAMGVRLKHRRKGILDANQAFA